MKIFLVLLIFCFGSAQAKSYNALQDHQKYRNQLKTETSKQLIENPRHLNYYKGRSTYGNFSQYSSQKNYVKKGIRFKVETSKSQKNINNNSQNTQNQKAVSIVNTIDSNHNTDAE